MLRLYNEKDFESEGIKEIKKERKKERKKNRKHENYEIYGKY